MKFQCPKCDVAYQVADERLSAGMRLRCKRCETVFALEDAKPMDRERPALLAPAALASGALASRRPVSISVKDEPAPFSSGGSRSGRPHLFAVPSASERPRAGTDAVEPEAPPSMNWRNPEPPPSLSPGRLSAPRVPSFGSSAPDAVGGLPDSLAPGASVWPDKSAPGSARQVPLVLAIVASAVSLLVGVLGGFLGSDLMASEPLAVARASLPASFTGVKSTPPSEPKPVSGTSANGAASTAPSASPPVEVQEAAKPASPSPAGKPAGNAAANGNAAAGARLGKVEPKAAPAEAFPMPALTPVEREAEPAAAAPLGERLTGAEIQRTVYRYQPSVRHSCWQRQLANRDPSAPSTAKVTVTMTIAPNGKVTKASTSGEAAGYPGLSGCIADKVKGWAFPQALGNTTAQVPFTFAAQ